MPKVNRGGVSRPFCESERSSRQSRRREFATKYRRVNVALGGVSALSCALTGSKFIGELSEGRAELGKGGGNRQSETDMVRA